MKLNKSLTSASNAMLVLSLLSERDMYGYEMITELKRRSKNVFEMQEGTLYPLLHLLEKDGCITSYEGEAETGRKRKYYRISVAGQAALKEKATEWGIFVKAVRETMGGKSHELLGNI